MNELEKLEQAYANMGAEIEALKNKPEKIDWTKMPADTFVEVWNYHGSQPLKRYFKKFNGKVYICFTSGKSSLTVSGENETFTWDNIRLIENEPKPWFGGECPIPNDVKFRVWFRLIGLDDISINASEFRWTHIGSDGDITAYQILGEEQ